MKKLSLLVAIMVATFSFAQDKGQWSFGVGSDFTTTPDANVGYFVMDGLMLGASFNMEMGDHGHTNWGLDARYYVTGDMFAQFGMSTSYAECCGAEDAHVHHADESDLDLAISVGCSKVLGFDGKLWFEPAIQMTMPGAEGADGVLGLTMGFRYTF